MESTVAIILVLGLLWAATMIYVYRDMSERNLPGWQQSLWVLVSLVPFAGFAAYLVGRLLSRPGPGSQALPAGAPQRVTLLQDPGMRQPTVEVAASSGSPLRPVRLLVTEGPHRGQGLNLQGFPATIGREVDSGVLLDRDLAVSRRHAELFLQAGRLWLRDLQSTHGTFVNGRRITECELPRGAKVRVGTTVLVVKTGR